MREAISSEPQSTAPTSSRNEGNLLLVLTAIGGALLLTTLLRYGPASSGDQYIYLADAWLHGRLDIIGLPPLVADQINYGGKVYIPFGPFPALLSLPAYLLFGYQAHTMYTAYPLAALSAWLLWRIGDHLGVERVRRQWLLLFFFFGSSYLYPLIHEGPSFLAHITTVAVSLAAILIVVRKPLASMGAAEWLAVGLLLGAAVLSRFTTGLVVFFFIVLIFAERRGWRSTIVPLVSMGAGLAVGVVIYFVYNYVRFGSFTESGFNYAQLTTQQLRDQLKVGLFSLEHLPTNLYYMFVKGFDPWPGANATTLSFPWLVPSIQGTSILIASPAIAYVLRPRLRQPLVLACWAAILPSFLAIIFYYASGLPQFGYRYSLDFMPFVAVLLLVAAHDHFSRLQRGLIAAGVLICVAGNLLVNFQLGL